MARPALAAVTVVVPAHEEEALLGRCLESMARAGRLLAAQRPEVVTTTTVVLDRCTDGSARIAAAAGVQVLAVAAGGPGAARALGVELAVSSPGPRRASLGDAQRVWVACTDADSAVPEDWLIHHVCVADAGHDLLVGAVQPDPDDLDASTLVRWWARHRLSDGHTHVFGANLGVRLSTYRQLGGFESLPTGEDVALVARARELGVPWKATARATVVTSGRRAGRADHGFASYLRDLV